MIEYKLPHESFIGGWFIDEKICDDLVNFFNNLDSTYKVPGSISLEGKPTVDKDKKDSIDFRFTDPKHLSYYLPYKDSLLKVLNEYKKKYPDSDDVSSYGIFENIGMQYYKKGCGFKTWHNERATGNHPVNKRHLVFMTYLNDVNDGGTEFKLQNLITPAKKGLTLIWPTDWTHTHRGVISNTQDKYIITGWFSYE